MLALTIRKHFFEVFRTARENKKEKLTDKKWKSLNQGIAKAQQSQENSENFGIYI